MHLGHKLVGSVIIMVQDLRVSPLTLSCHSSHSPAIVNKPRRAVARGEIPGLLAAGRVLPLIIPGHRDRAAIALKGAAKERLVDDSLSAGIKKSPASNP